MIELPYSGPCKAAVKATFPELVLKEESSIDELVILFLLEHDVNVRPPSGSNVSGAVSRRLVAGLDPEVGGLMKIEKNQRVTAAAQEWTSWKQWALSHEDWKLYKSNHSQDVENHNANARVLACLPETKAKVDAFVEEEKRQLKKSLKTLGIYFLVLLSIPLLLAAWVSFSSTINNTNKPSPSLVN